MKIADITSYLEQVYPLKYALDWDNCGLQVGDLLGQTDTVVITLTVTPQVVEKALALGSKLIIAHHPLIFTPLKHLDTSSPSGKLIQTIIQNELTVYSLHTNLDIASKGVSDALAAKFGCAQTQVLQVTNSEKLSKLIVYIPAEYFLQFREQFLQTKVGHIGNYSHCSFSSLGEGTFLPEQESHPFIGEIGHLSKVQEYKLETIVKDADVSQVLALMKNYHPYEEVAYDLVPLINTGQQVGLGRYAEVSPLSLGEFSQKWPAGSLKGNTDSQKSIKRIGFCGGNGSSLLKRVIALDIDLYITAEIGYHDELLAKDHNLTVLDLGHELSEVPVLDTLQKVLNDKFPSLTLEVV